MVRRMILHVEISKLKSQKKYLNISQDVADSILIQIIWRMTSKWTQED